MGMVIFNLWLSFLTVKQFFKQKTPPNYAKKPEPPKEPSPQELLAMWRRQQAKKNQAEMEATDDEPKVSLKKKAGRPKKEAPNLEIGEETRLV